MLEYEIEQNSQPILNKQKTSQVSLLKQLKEKIKIFSKLKDNIEEYEGNLVLKTIILFPLSIFVCSSFIIGLFTHLNISDTLFMCGLTTIVFGLLPLAVLGNIDIKKVKTHAKHYFRFFKKYRSMETTIKIEEQYIHENIQNKELQKSLLSYLKDLNIKAQPYYEDLFIEDHISKLVENFSIQDYNCAQEYIISNIEYWEKIENEILEEQLKEQKNIHYLKSINLENLLEIENSFNEKEINLKNML